jgi:oligoribonuclease NrnB/cAMP/cGMP phosphodiesterase (DHH superfamily)
MYVWEHDRADETNYISIDDVDNDLSMKISATYLVGTFFTYNNNLVNYEWKSVTISDFGYRSIALFKLIEDISKYDTWEWKTNKFIRVTKHEDMPQVLIKIVGITKATALILDTIYHSTNFKERYSISYFPREYGMMYEYLKYKSFDYVKKSLMNVKLLDTQGIRELESIIGCDLSDLNRVFISLSDNTIDVNEQATFMTEFLDNEFGEGTSVFMHIFVSSSTLSMRTCRDYDVSHIAKALGGGGHKGAAGARITTDTLLSLIRLYHESGIDLEIVIKKSIYTNYLSDYSKTLTPITTFDYSVKVER